MLAAAAASACASGPAETVNRDAAARGPAQLIVLGTAQDGGLPHAACHCARCMRARVEPTAARAAASLALWLPDEDRVWLIDATPDIRVQLDRLAGLRGRTPRGVDRAPVDAVLLTHAHWGHYAGLGFFGFEAVHTRGLPVYCTPTMAEFLRANGPWSQLVALGNVVLHPLDPGRPLLAGSGVEILPLRVPHRREFTDTVGFLIRGPRQRVLYVPDTDGWDDWEPPLESWLDDVDVALLDGTFHSADELPGRDLDTIGHPLITSTMDRLERRVRDGGLRVYFTHLNHSNLALDAESGARTALRQRGFDLLADGQRLPL